MRGGELGRAGVDGLVDRPDAEPVAQRAARRPRRPAPAAVRRSAGRTGRAAWPGAAAPGSSVGASRTAVADLVHQQDLVDEPRVDTGGLGDLLDGRAGRAAPARRRRGGRRPAPRSASSSSSTVARSAAGPVQKPAAFVSSRPHRLASASGKLRPIDIASPTLFMSWSAAGRRRGTSRTRTAAPSPRRSPASARRRPGCRR